MLAQHADPQLTIRPTGSASKSRLTLKLVPFVGPSLKETAPSSGWILAFLR
jgi:hypothetical protein